MYERINTRDTIHIRDRRKLSEFPRMWGAEVFDDQQVGPEHLVSDGDLLELHL